MNSIALRLLGLLSSLALGVLVGCDNSQSATASQSPEPSIEVRKLQDLQPRDEAALTAIPNEAYEAERVAPNDIRRNEISAEWNEKSCSALRRLGAFSDWVGRVTEIEDGYFEVSIPNVGDGALELFDHIDSGSKLYPVVHNMNRDAAVSVTGTILPSLVVQQCSRDEDPFLAISAGNGLEVHFTSISVLPAGTSD